MEELISKVESANSVKQLKEALIDLSGQLSDDIIDDNSARFAKMASRAFALASGKIGAAAKAYFRGY